MASRPKLLIIGGGFAGATLATKACSFAEVTLVDPKEYLELTWATVRGIIDKNVAERACFDYKSIPAFKDVKVVKGVVTSLTSKEATLGDGAVLSFDYVAICSGSAYSDAFKSEGARTQAERVKELEAIAGRIRAAKSVVVVGGGPAGVEAAAEVAEAFAGKEITLVHPGKQLLSTLPPKAGALAKKWLEAHNVKVLLETSVTSPRPQGPAGPAELTLGGAGQSGAALHADLVLWCAGSKPNTAFLSGGDLEGALDGKGLIKVEDTLQVEGHSKVFALGDCNNVPEAKQGYLASKHAELAAASIQALIKAAASGNSVAKLGKWKPSMGTEMMLVTLGRADGVCRVGGSVCGGCLPANMKSKGLFIEQYRKVFNVTN